MENISNQFNFLKNNLDNLDTMSIDSLDLSRTILYIVDMNNGFAKNGLLYSDRIEKLINPICDFTNKVLDDINQIIAFTDCHDENSIELLSYPTHCLNNDIESEIIDELKSIPKIKVLPKNSTNGFFVLKDYNFDNIDNIIIVGDCTDICIYQFATTLKSYFNQYNLNKDVIVPMNLVDTYNIDNIHPAELLNIVFFNSMIQNGINVIKSFN